MRAGERYIQSSVEKKIQPHNFTQGRKYKIIPLENPEIEIIGTFECGILWKNNTERNHLFNFINDNFYDICEDCYDAYFSIKEQEKYSLKEYINGQLQFIYDYHSLGDKHFLFSEVECNNSEYIKNNMQRYEYNPRLHYHNNVFTIPCFSSEECQIIEI